MVPKSGLFKKLLVCSMFGKAASVREIAVLWTPLEGMSDLQIHLSGSGWEF